MTGALLAIAFMVLIGLAITAGIDRGARGPLLIGTGFLYGSGWMMFALLALSLLRIEWRPMSVVVAGLLSCLVALSPSRHGQPGNLATWKPHALDLLSLITAAGFSIFATIAPMWEWDFWVMWGLKARVFWEHRGIDWAFLESRWNDFNHVDYPLLLPLNIDVASVFNGIWDDRWMGLLYVAWAVALMLIVRGLASREAPPRTAAIITFVALAIAATDRVGMAEGPMIAFGSAGVLFVRSALRSDSPADWRHGALLLGLAANVKNEGIALLVSVLVALLLLRRWRAAARLWPAVVLALPWLILRVSHHLATDIFTLGPRNIPIAERVAMRIPRGFEIGAMLASMAHDPAMWVALLAGILIVPATLRREAFVLLVTAIQVAFYIATYFATPNDLRWHIRTSWGRLTEQVAVPVAYAVVMMLSESLALHSGDCQAPAESSRTPVSS